MKTRTARRESRLIKWIWGSLLWVAPISAGSADEYPSIPERQLPVLKAIPNHGEFVVEVGEAFGRNDPAHMTRTDVSIFDLAARKEFRWDLAHELLDGLAPQSSLHRASWAPQTSNLLFAKLNEAFLISKDGNVRALNLQMPGHLKPFDGIDTYAVSSDGQFVAFYLYTRDNGDLQPDRFGKLYVDLMIEKTSGSAPVTLMRQTRPAALAWSPDGQKIAYGTYDGRVVVLNRSGKELLSVQAGTPARQAGIGGEFIWDLKWHPDGNELGILVYPSRRLRLVDDKGTFREVDINSTGLFKKKVTLDSFAWSPDGQRLAFRSGFEAAENCNHLAFGYKFNTGNFPCVNGSNLYTSNANGTALTRIIPKTEYAYASQGELFWIQ